MKKSNLNSLKLAVCFALFLVGQFVSAQCNNCNDPSNAITNNLNGTFTAATSAQSYYWEICSGNAVISGSNTSQSVSINCLSVGTVKLKLVRFSNGQCYEYCEEFICTTSPLTCPDDSCIQFSAVAVDGGYCTDVGLSLVCDAVANADSIVWQYSIGPSNINYTGPFQTFGTSTNNGTYNWAGAPLSFPHGNWDGMTLHIKAIVTLSDGTVCDEIFSSIRLKCENRIGFLEKRENHATISTNPASKSFTFINSSNYKIVNYSILNINGLEVLNKNYNKNDPVNVSNLKNGLYFIQVKYENGDLDKIKLIVSK